MTDRPSEPDGTTQAWTQAGEPWAAASDLRVPGLTVIYHPNVERAGERAVLDGLDSAQGAGISRFAPEFAAIGADHSRPLNVARLSRAPIVLRKFGDDISIDSESSRTYVEVDGKPLNDSLRIPFGSLEEGTVLMLGGQVVLLLHLLDPMVDTSTPRFGLVGESPAMARVRRDIVQTADLGISILLRGESGTGKELVARAIHDHGPRSPRPYVAINMAALPPSLASAELFGSERGAYTGAERRRDGLFAQADSGTLFLDEIGETPTEIQALLLRALETGEILPVGGGRSRRVDTRVVAATDADLELAIDRGGFREPLLHRLSGFVIRLPALRDRREDFGRLWMHFLHRELEALGLSHRLTVRDRPWLPASVVARLAAWHWPGNVRQLANVVRQVVIANRDLDPATRFEEVETLLARSPDGKHTSAGYPSQGRSLDGRPNPLAREKGFIGEQGDGRTPNPGGSQTSGARSPSDFREQEIVAALRAHRFRPAAAAAALGIPRSSLYDLIDKIPGLRKASELSREDIESTRRQTGPSLEALADALEVSQRALSRRLRELGLDDDSPS